MMKVDRKEICKYVAAYDPSLKVGEQLGKGGMACVFDLPETEPVQVIKVMDTGCQGFGADYSAQRPQGLCHQLRSCVSGGKGRDLQRRRRLCPFKGYERQPGFRDYPVRF